MKTIILPIDRNVLTKALKNIMATFTQGKLRNCRDLIEELCMGVAKGEEFKLKPSMINALDSHDGALIWRLSPEAYQIPQFFTALMIGCNPAARSEIDAYCLGLLTKSAETKAPASTPGDLSDMVAGKIIFQKVMELEWAPPPSEVKNLKAALCDLMIPQQAPSKVSAPRTVRRTIVWDGNAFTLTVEFDDSKTADALAFLATTLTTPQLQSLDQRANALLMGDHSPIATKPKQEKPAPAHTPASSTAPMQGNKAPAQKPITVNS